MKTFIAPVPADIIVKADAFRAYREAKARAAAAQKEADAARKLAGIPSTEDLVNQLDLSKGEKGEVVIKDGNGVPMGKIAVFWKDGFEMPAGFQARIS